MRRRGWKPKSNERVTEKNYKELLELEYDGKFQWTEPRGKNNKVRIGIKCNDCGHEWEAAPYDMLKRGRACPVCKTMDRKKEKFEELKDKLAELFGRVPYKFLSEYENVHTHMKVQCLDCGHISEITPTNMINVSNKVDVKHQCSNCFLDDVSKNKRNDINLYMDKMEREFGKRYEIVNPEDFKGSTMSLKFKCLECGYVFESNQYNLWQVQKKSNGEKYVCPSCNNMIHDKRPYEVRLEEVNPNIIALEDYVNLDTHIKHKCLVCDHIWNSPPHSRLSNPGCPSCNNIITESKMERELEEFIEEVYDGKIVSNDRSLLGNRQEIDIYLPEFKLGIEMHGLYWHNEEKKGKKYHYDKMEKAEENDIRLIQIFEDEWINKSDIVKSKILHLMHLNTSNPVYARQCYIDEITPQVKNKFLNDHHIQGEDRSSIHLGLFKKSDNELVSVMTFGRLRTSLGYEAGNKQDYELSRYASKKYYNVVGGFSKMLKYFERNYEYNKMITYADLRYSSRIGNVYEVNGFTKTHESRPGYWYFHRNDISKKYHRYNFRKNVLESKFGSENFNADNTEYENMKANNYLRIWDCGNMVFEKINMQDKG